MSYPVHVAAFENGTLRFLESGAKAREAVLALPLSRLLTAVVRVPNDARGDPASAALPVLKAMCPYPDDELTVGWEPLVDTPERLVILAAALPESGADDIAEALDAAKVNVTRVDLLPVGRLRGIWSALGELVGRRLVLMKEAEGLSLVVLEGDVPCAIRAVSDGGDLKREVMLSLLEAEDAAGPSALREIVCVGDLPQEGLSAFAPVRTVDCGEDVPLVGVAERAADANGLNALPASWREVLDEARFKRKLVKALAWAAGIWLFAVLIVVGVPFGYGFMTDHQKDLCRAHAKKYQAVSEMKKKVKLVQQYSDHSRGALEIMKALSDRLPEGITLNSWLYKRDDCVKLSGEAERQADILDFKDRVDKLAGEAEEGDAVFATTQLNNMNARGGKQRFDLDCLYHREDEQ